MKDVYFDFGCFATILSAVVESYPKETYGFVGGEDTKTRVNLKMSPPLCSQQSKQKQVLNSKTKKDMKKRKVLLMRWV